MPPGGAEGDLTAALAGLWERRRDSFAQRASVVEAAVVSLLSGSVPEEDRAEAEREAHKLAGSLGTFGLPGGTELARELELGLAAERLEPAAAPRLAEIVHALQREIERGPAAPAVLDTAPDGDDVAADRAVLLVLSADDELADRLAAEAGAQGLATVRGVADVETEGRPAEVPVAVIVDLDAPADGPSLRPATPVVALSADGALDQRVRAARNGASVFLQRSASAARVLAAVVDLLDRLTTEHATVLALDDDPDILDAVTSLLTPRGVNVTGVSDPEHLWSLLGDADADLLVLDVDMPTVDGIEMCRVVRADPRFAELGILFLTARDDPGLLERLFAAGADDYVSKPIVAAELVGRIENRLARARAARQLADRDAVTGIANRRKASAEIARALLMAERYGHPLSIAVLDLDRFKAVNDRHGHAAGDSVLRVLGGLLGRSFRREDTVGRWGGEEFVVCLYGADRADAVTRIQTLLARFSALEHPVPSGPPLRCTFSAGVAAFPADAADLEALHQAADEALYAAKGAGRNRVLPAGWQPPAGSRAVDVVIVEDDDTLAELLTQALATRGYSTARLADGAEAAGALGGPAPRLRGRLVLMDVDLPGLDGLSLLRRLAREGASGDLRVIMLTARSAETEVVQALELGAVDHVAKPFSVPVLMQRVQRALASSG